MDLKTAAAVVDPARFNVIFERMLEISRREGDGALATWRAGLLRLLDNLWRWGVDLVVYEAMRELNELGPNMSIPQEAPLWTFPEPRRSTVGISFYTLVFLTLFRRLGHDVPSTHNLLMPEKPRYEGEPPTGIPRANRASLLAHGIRYWPWAVPKMLEYATYGEKVVQSVFTQLLTWDLPAQAGKRTWPCSEPRWIDCYQRLIQELLAPPHSILPRNWESPTAMRWYYETHKRDPNLDNAPTSGWNATSSIDDDGIELVEAVLPAEDWLQDASKTGAAIDVDAPSPNEEPSTPKYGLVKTESLADADAPDDSPDDSVTECGSGRDDDDDFEPEANEDDAKQRLASAEAMAHAAQRARARLCNAFRVPILVSRWWEAARWRRERDNPRLVCGRLRVTVHLTHPLEPALAEGGGGSKRALDALSDPQKQPKLSPSSSSFPEAMKEEEESPTEEDGGNRGNGAPVDDAEPLPPMPDRIGSPYPLGSSRNRPRYSEWPIAPRQKGVLTRITFQAAIGSCGGADIYYISVSMNATTVVQTYLRRIIGKLPAMTRNGLRSPSDFRLRKGTGYLPENVLAGSLLDEVAKAGRGSGGINMWSWSWVPNIDPKQVSPTGKLAAPEPRLEPPSRLRYTDAQLTVMESTYHTRTSRMFTCEEQTALAEKVGVSVHQVQSWLQNRRNRDGGAQAHFVVRFKKYGETHPDITRMTELARYFGVQVAFVGACFVALRKEMFYHQLTNMCAPAAAPATAPEVAPETAPELSNRETTIYVRAPNGVKPGDRVEWEVHDNVGRFTFVMPDFPPNTPTGALWLQMSVRLNKKFDDIAVGQRLKGINVRINGEGSSAKPIALDDSDEDATVPAPAPAPAPAAFHDAQWSESHEPAFLEKLASYSDDVRSLPHLSLEHPSASLKAFVAEIRQGSGDESILVIACVPSWCNRMGVFPQYREHAARTIRSLCHLPLEGCASNIPPGRTEVPHFALTINNAKDMCKNAKRRISWRAEVDAQEETQASWDADRGWKGKFLRNLSNYEFVFRQRYQNAHTLPRVQAASRDLLISNAGETIIAFSTTDDWLATMGISREELRTSKPHVAGLLRILLWRNANPITEYRELIDVKCGNIFAPFWVLTNKALRALCAGATRTPIRELMFESEPLPRPLQQQEKEEE